MLISVQDEKSSTPPWAATSKDRDKDAEESVDTFSAFRLGTPYAKEGYLYSTKKGTFGKYGSLRQRWVTLIPSLGSLLYFRKQEDLVPVGVIGLPKAYQIYPKRGIIQIKSKVHVYSIRIILPERNYTLICNDEVERDDWVLKLRTVGERWNHSEQCGLQVCVFVCLCACVRVRRMIAFILRHASVRALSNLRNWGCESTRDTLAQGTLVWSRCRQCVLESIHGKWCLYPNTDLVS